MHKNLLHTSDYPIYIDEEFARTNDARSLLQQLAIGQSEQQSNQISRIHNEPVYNEEVKVDSQKQHAAEYRMKIQEIAKQANIAKIFKENALKPSRLKNTPHIIKNADLHLPDVINNQENVFQTLLGLPEISIETLYMAAKEKDKTILNLMNEHTNFIQIHEGYPEFLNF